jgi:hypothetical protein
MAKINGPPIRAGNTGFASRRWTLFASLMGLDCPVVKISDKTDEGLQFHNMTGGIAAFVKY